jgi:hypothetical protein
MCEQLDTPCIIDLTQDMRRRTALQRTIEESKALQDALTGVIGLLRSGDRSEIQTLIKNLQQITDEEKLVETLQSKLQETRESDSLSLDGQMSKEDHKAPNSGSDDEEKSELWKGSFPVSFELPKKQTSSMQNDDLSSISIDPVQSGSVGNRKFESLASLYLPLISKLRTVSVEEAVHVLHVFTTSPVSAEDVAALNLLDRRRTRLRVNVRTGRYSRDTSSGGAFSPDRTGWHSCLQLTKAALQTSIAGIPSQGQWIDQSSGHNTTQVRFMVLAQLILPSNFRTVL